MNATELIAIVDAEKPNSFDATTKKRWLKTIEYRICKEIISRHELKSGLLNLNFKGMSDMISLPSATEMSVGDYFILTDSSSNENLSLLESFYIYEKANNPDVDSVQVVSDLMSFLSGYTPGSSGLTYAKGSLAIVVNEDSANKYIYKPNFEGYVDYALQNGHSLLLPCPWEDVYRYYLFEQIDLTYNEYERAQNDAALFNRSWLEFNAYYTRNARPNSKGFRYI